MNILHYNLGVPPLRSGGMTKYSIDLILGLKNRGHSVHLLSSKECYSFKKRGQIIGKGQWNGIDRYVIKSSAPTPLLHGVASPRKYYRNINFDKSSLERFFKETTPDIFHIHTLMGLPLDLILFLKSKGTQIIYTSHDYYGLCLKVNFIDYERELCAGASAEKCFKCNENALSDLPLYLRNLDIVLKMKSLLKGELNFLLHKYPDDRDLKIKHTPIDECKIREYMNLLEYYKLMFSYVDFFHFNSHVSQSVYKDKLTIPKGKVIPISHMGIGDFRTKKVFKSDKLKLAFIGSLDDYKGFSILKETLLKTTRSTYKWELKVWGNQMGTDKDCKEIKYQGKYHSNQIGEIFNTTDLLIVPSIWKETFSLIVLEALSHGTPVLVSNNVGAKDIVKRYASDFVYETQEELESILTKVLNDRSVLENYNSNILSLSWYYSYENHINSIQDMYNQILLNENRIY